MMKSVKIAALKANLSSYLKATGRGEEIVVYDRNLPVAKIIPFQQEGVLTIVPPKITWAKAWAEAKSLGHSTDDQHHLFDELMKMREEER